MGKKRTAGQTPVRVAVKDLPTIRIDELIPYENNAKIHGPEQIKQLRRSLREFGFVSPVLIDEEPDRRTWARRGGAGRRHDRGPVCDGERPDRGAAARLHHRGQPTCRDGRVGRGAA